jgi:uncharacterized YigZ family protein
LSGNNLALYYLPLPSYIVGMEDEFTTIRARAEAETRIEDSRFVATAVPVDDRDEAIEAVLELRRRFHDATHNCFAYVITEDDFRVNDDGEPAGSAGRPILGAIQKAGLRGTLVVVTRYFGGTKLGVAGLKRAYGGAASRVLQKAEKLTRFVTERITCTVPHALIGAVIQTASRHGAKVLQRRFDEEAHLVLEVRTSAAGTLRAALSERTSGAARMGPA